MEEIGGEGKFGASLIFMQNGQYSSNSPQQFLEREDKQGVYYKDKLALFTEKIHRLMIKIWPSIYGFLKSLIFHTIRILKGSIKIALSQIKL